MCIFLVSSIIDVINIGCCWGCFRSGSSGLGQPVPVRRVPEVPDYVRNSFYKDTSNRNIEISHIRNIFAEDNAEPPVPPARSSLNHTAIMEAETWEEIELHPVRM